MEISLERRQDGRQLAQSLQRRVVKQYLDGLNSLFMHYTAVSLQNQRQFAECQVPHEEIQGGTIFGQKIKILYEHRAGLQLTTKEFHRLLDDLVSGFEFVVSITDERKIPFTSVLPVSRSKCDIFSLSPLVEVVVRRMLINFDFGDFDAAAHLADLVFDFATNHPEVLALNSTLHTVMSAPPCTVVTPALLCGISKHVQGLIPVYQYALERLGWHRFAGTVAQDAPRNVAQCGDLEGVITFIEKILTALAQSKQDLKVLVVSNQTRKFVFDTLADPIVLASISLQKALFDDKVGVSRHLQPLLRLISDKTKTNELDLDLIPLTSSSEKELRKSKYDSFRVKLVRVCFAMLRVADSSNYLLALDSFSQRRMAENEGFAHCRFQILPTNLYQLVLLMKIAFVRGRVLIELLMALAVMHCDLDVADNYHLKTNEGEPVCPRHLTGGLKSPESVKATGTWSFGLVFNIFGRSFLNKYASRDERRQLFIIDAVAKERVLVGHVTEIESEIAELRVLAFDTAEELAALEDISIAESEVSLALLEILNNPNNHVWCHHFNGDGQRKRWAKDKGRKYSKIIGRLQNGILGTDVARHLDERTEGVKYLMEKLQQSILQFRKLPTSLQETIAATKSHERILEASAFIKQWTREELQKIGSHLIQLETSAEAVTTFFHVSTGGAFPVVKSIMNPNWTMQAQIAIDKFDFAMETSNAIRDLRYVHSVLQWLHVHRSRTQHED